jgi:dTDP-4-dehydrorhamnose reductase
MWAGIECTVNRVGDTYHDQLEKSGHARRLDDLELFACLGVRTLRYPVLWERTAPDGLDKADWTWPTERLIRLRELGIRPIVGLLHHGSGPRFTSLIDPAFPDQFAEYAREVARRFPWVECYTPVNEPLTTARFSGLYGHWYPHGMDDLTFARALVAQCRATVLAMRAIREVNPSATLVQTEDLGKTFSTPALAYQADFENERRWLTFDLLCGLLDERREMWGYMRWAGLEESELKWFLDNPCPPDLIGINHYLTGERFLDERIEGYPSRYHGSNGRCRYADVEAVRVLAGGTAGPETLIREAWDRYRLPIAVTEAHLGCTREEQMRWLKEVWDGARRLRSNGVDVRAVTAWSALGVYDWNSLVTRADGCYEAGAFDVRAPRPRPTGLARMICDLAGGREHNHPVLDSPGWWRRNDRLFYPAITGEPGVDDSPEDERRSLLAAARPLLITGATGTLGRAFSRLCDSRGLAYRLLTRGEMDIADAASIELALAKLKPWAVINAAGYVRVDDAEQEADRCMRENADGPATLAAACADNQIEFLTFSSDLVFDGLKNEPYVESDAVAPMGVYGQSKALAEEAVLRILPSALVIRTSAFFGPWDQYNFITMALRALMEGEEFIAANDLVVSPTYLPDLINKTLDLLIDGERGLWHIANAGSITWVEFARLAASLAGVSTDGLKSQPARSLLLRSARPRYSVLRSERGEMLPPLESALARYITDSEMTCGRFVPVVPNESEACLSARSGR